MGSEGGLTDAHTDGMSTRRIQAIIAPSIEAMGYELVRVMLTGGSGWLPERGSVYRVETGWRRDGDDWLLTSARWERDL